MQRTIDLGIQRVSIPLQLNTTVNISGPCVITIKRNGRLCIDAHASVSVRIGEREYKKTGGEVYHLENIRPQ